MEKLIEWINTHIKPLSDKLEKNKWIISLQEAFFILVPNIIYLSQSTGLLHVFHTDSAMASANMPLVLRQFVIGGMDGIILMVIIMVVSGLIYYPFFKAYERECVEAEKADAQT